MAPKKLKTPKHALSSKHSTIDVQSTEENIEPLLPAYDLDSGSVVASSVKMLIECVNSNIQEKFLKKHIPKYCIRYTLEGFKYIQQQNDMQGDKDKKCGDCDDFEPRPASLDEEVPSTIKVCINKNSANRQTGGFS